MVSINIRQSVGKENDSVIIVQGNPTLVYFLPASPPGKYTLYLESYDALSADQATLYQDKLTVTVLESKTDKSQNTVKDNDLIKLDEEPIDAAIGGQIQKLLTK